VPFSRLGPASAHRHAHDQPGHRVLTCTPFPVEPLNEGELSLGWGKSVLLTRAVTAFSAPLAAFSSTRNHHHTPRPSRGKPATLAAELDEAS
jgi:hypothetical protein